MPDLQTLRYGLRGSVTKWFERPAVSVLIALKVSANGATVIGLLIALVAAYFVSEGDFLLGGILVLVGADGVSDSARALFVEPNAETITRLDAEERSPETKRLLCC